MKKLYICHTFYHVYITLIKEIKNNKTADIMLSDSIPEYKSLKKRIDKCNIFNEVFILNESLIDFPSKYTISRYILYYKNITKKVERYLSLDINLYDEVVIYNDYSKIGYYLNAKKIRYILNEDGLDLYKKECDFLTKRFKPNFFDLFLVIMKLDFLCVGYSKCMTKLEVNDIKDIVLKNKQNIVEVPRKLLINSLDKQEKDIISSVLLENVEIKQEKKNILILTEPLYIDRRVESEAIQLKIYESIVEKYYINYNVYLKPHPRDTINYSHLFEKCSIISKNMPIEILNFNENIIFDKAITITSSSIYGIYFVKNKIRLGIDFLNEYINKKL